MDNVITGHITEITMLIAILALGWLIGLPLRRRAAKSATPLGALLEPLSTPLAVLLFSVLLKFIRERLPEFSTICNRTLLDTWLTVWMVVTILAASEGLAALLFRLRGRVFPLPSLLRNLIRGILLGAAVLAVLRYGLQINISPLLASTALLTAILGFALQGVLGNLLAGMSIHLTRSTHPGDWIAMGEVEGEVLQTNWRETHLRTTGGHIMIVPNSKLADAVVHNMSWPTPPRRHSIYVGASYEAAPAEVAQALLNAAAAVPAVLRDPAPAAFPIEYKDFGINYELRIWTTQHQDRTPITGAVNRMIWYQFKRHGIEIPFPMSDKLLCDFMEVIHTHQQRPPRAAEQARRLQALQHSDFCARLLVDASGQSLLNTADWEALAPLLRCVRYTTGETIFRQGEAGEACYIVTHGRLHGRMEFQDTTAANEFDLTTGALCGEMSFLTGLPRTATLTAPEEVELLEISSEAFTRLLALHPEIPERLAQLVADRTAQNAQNYERLKAVGAATLNGLKRDNLLQRFKRLLGLANHRGAT